MTLEEKQAIQTVLLDELSRRQQEQPTLLIDALLSGQGYQFVHHVLSTKLGYANSVAQAMTGLLRAIQAPEKSEDAA